MRICGEKRHLTSCIAPVGTMRVGLDEFPDGEAIRGFSWGDRNVLAHESSPCSICLDAQLGLLENGSGFEVRLDPVLAILSASAGIFESSPGGLRIIRHVVDHDAPSPYL